MSWILEGKNIRAMYLGMPVQGKVTESRVKYGGKVQHTIQLDSPLNIYGRVADVVLVQEADVRSIV